MKLRRLVLENFRCFAKAEFDFTDPHTGQPSNVALLVGENGSGKSSALDAIAGFFGAFNPGYGARLISSKDIQHGTANANIFLEWSDVGFPSLSLACKFKENLNIAHLFAINKDNEDRWMKAIRSTKPHSVGLIVSFDVYRYMPSSYVPGPKRDVWYSFLNALAPSVNNNEEKENRYRFLNLKQWIVNLDYYRIKAKADHNEGYPAWEQLRQGLNTLLAPNKFVGVNNNFDVLFESPTGTVPLESLSDGMRSLFVIIVELMFRLSLSNDDPAKMLEQEAVCLIDEIDAHLHPKLQKRVLPMLTTLFPKVQFIATTHSPYVVASAEPHQVFLIGPDIEED